MTSGGERKPRVGLIITPVEDRARGIAPGWREIVTMARLAEDVGFDSVWVSDHLIHRFEGIPAYGMPECWSVLSALAAATERVRIGTWVLCAAWRNPALLAKMAVTVDEISGGRLILGLGAGWHEPEYEAFGFPFDHRVGRFAESLTIIAGLLRDGQVDFEGRFYSARECVLRPRGPRPGGPPIMIGTIAGSPLARRLGVASGGERMMGLVAKYADIWNVPWLNDPAEEPELQARADAACRAIGREPATLQRTHGVAINLPGWQETPGNEVIRAPRAQLGAFEGEPEELAERLRAFGAAGVNEVHVQLDPESLAGIEAFAATLELL